MFNRSRSTDLHNPAYPERRLLAPALALALAVLTACEPPATPLPRSATVGDVVNVVTARAGGESEFVAVSDGYLVADGGEIKTDVDARAKLILNDGIIIRMAPVTHLINDSPAGQWKFKLPNGKIWISLFGGALILETPLGSVTVFGNSVEFEYQPGDSADLADDVFIIQCLQGSCHFQNGRADLQLNDLEQIMITHNGDTVNRLKLSSAQLDEFIANNPETAGILAGLRLSAPKFTGTAVAVQVPTLVFFAPATDEGLASATLTPARTPTRRFPTATFPFVTFTFTPSDPTISSFPTVPHRTSPPGVRPPGATNTPTPHASSAGPSLTPQPSATPVTPSATVPTRTPAPTKTLPPTPTKTPAPTNTPIPPTNTPVPTDTPIPPTDTPIPPTDTPAPPTATPT
jgi:hypothetical protein